MAKGKMNIGGYDQNAFFDCRGVNYLERKLLETHLLMPKFKKMDKYPNLDGSFEVCETKMSDTPQSVSTYDSSFWQRAIPVCTFEVQIKTLNGDYINHNTSPQAEHSDFKYSCDTKAMNYVLKSGTLNPVLLMLVDWKNNHIFWKYLSQEYCLQLDIEKQVDKTIYFNRTDEIVNIQEWIQILKEIYAELVRKSQNEEEACFMTNASAVKKIPANILNEMQAAFDFINGLYEHELKFVRDALFPDVWKFGIAYVKNTEMGFSYAGIYKIKQGEDKTFFKSFEEDENGGYIRKIYFGGTSLKEIVTDAIESHIRLLFDKTGLIPKITPDCVLLQIFYKEIDETLFHKQSKRIKTEQQGEKIDIEWTKSIMTLSEYKQLVENGIASLKAQSCADELLHRGYKKFERPFEENKSHIININGEISEDGIYSIGFDPNYDRNALDKRNMRRLFDGVASLYHEGRNLIGNPEGLALKAHYSCWVLDDFSKIYFKAIEADEFQFNWMLVSESEYKDILEKSRCDIPSQGAVWTWLCISPARYSWSRLWQAIFMSMALNTIGRGKDAITLYREL